MANCSFTHSSHWENSRSKHTCTCLQGADSQMKVSMPLSPLPWLKGLLGGKVRISRPPFPCESPENHPRLFLPTYLLNQWTNLPSSPRGCASGKCPMQSNSNSTITLSPSLPHLPPESYGIPLIASCCQSLPTQYVSHTVPGVTTPKTNTISFPKLL